MRAIWPTESQIQVTLIAWCRAQSDGRKWAIHVPNEGKRSPRRGAQMKREGMLPGASDILIPMARGGFHGLWVELKAHGKHPTDKQYKFLAAMRDEGYDTFWTDDLDMAMRHISHYADGLRRRPDWVHYEAPARCA